MRLNLGPGTHYAPGWWNIDVRDDLGVRCDQVVDAAAPFADFETDNVEAVFLGHVLEHVPWPGVVPLLGEVRRVLAPGCAVLATGPDVYRTILRWRDGLEPWDLLCSVLEHGDEADAEWPEAVHKWNCHESRLVGALAAAGFDQVTPIDADEAMASGWPIVAPAPWQCAVRAVKG